MRDAYWHIARVLRIQNKIDEALAIQLRIGQESRAAGQPRYYIFEELQLLYEAKGESQRARHYEARARALR